MIFKINFFSLERCLDGIVYPAPHGQSLRRQLNPVLWSVADLGLHLGTFASTLAPLLAV